MARARVQMCPHGHNKDIQGNSYLYTRITIKGTLIYVRCCAVCKRNETKAKREIPFKNLRIPPV